jgi:hypothetical protein
MSDFDYAVEIQGMEQVPLRTTAEGAKMLMATFDQNGEKACEILITAMQGGIRFKSDLVTISWDNNGRIKKPKGNLLAGAKIKRRSSRSK